MSEQREFSAAQTRSLPETRKFYAILFLPSSLLLELTFADGVEEHNLVFFQSTKLIPYM